MKSFQLFVILLFQECIAYFYPALFWHKDNCGFQHVEQNNNGTREFFIKVVPNNGMNIVCPNHVTINNWLTDAGVSSPSLMENMWQVDKQGYDKCKVNEQGDPNINKLVLLCDRPRQIKFKPFLFHPRFNNDEPRFAPGQHYYFISTSRGFKDELTTRKISGSDGSCERYHMKLHIYVCNPKKEDCIWEVPHCDPPQELHREMLMIDGKLPAPTHPGIVTTPSPELTKKTTKKTQLSTPHLKKTFAYKKLATNIKPAAQKMCNNKEKGVSIHLILNFVLGGVALFMVIVIIILACGLSRKSKEYKPQRPPSTSSVHEPNKNTYVETVRYTDLPHQLTPSHRPPPASPFSNYLILQQVSDQNYTAQRTPLSYDGKVFRFPDVAERKPTQTEDPSQCNNNIGIGAV